MRSLSFRQRGITLIEILVSLGIMAGVIAGVARLADQYISDTKSSLTAQQVVTVAKAGEAYIKDNFTAVAGNATAVQPALITVPMLIAAGYLESGFAVKNNYGQSMCILVLEPTANKLAGMVIAEGGTTIDDLTLGNVAMGIGASGGAVYSTDTTKFRGAMGGWEVAVGAYANANNANQKCDGTAGTPAIAAGRPAMALWFANGDATSGFLYRNAVPGRPELNTMNTPIIMAATNVLNDPCATLGAISRDAAGKVLSCDGSNWKRQGSAYWEDPVLNVASLPDCNASSAWQTRVVRTPTTGSGPRAFTCDGTSWQALAVDDSGNLTVPNNLTVSQTATINKLAGNLEVTATAVEGTACAPNGRIARDTNGLILSCQSGVWTPTPLRNVPGEGQVLKMTGANGVVMHLENINGTLRLVNSNWTQELFSVDQNGNVVAAGTIGDSGSLCGGASFLNGYGWYPGAPCRGVTLPGCPAGYYLSQVGMNLMGNIGAGNTGAGTYSCVKN